MTAAARTAGRRQRRIGVLGGTFDPPHRGHLALAKRALEELSLDEVLLMPVHTPPHKAPQPGGAPPEMRLQMCRLAAAGIEGLLASDIEVRRPGPSYTVDTLEAIHDAHPDASLTLILGADMALTLPAWRRPRRLLQLAEVAVAERDGAGREQVLAAVKPLEAGAARVRFLAMPPDAVSSSQVRERAAAGLGIDGLVPEPVASYVAKRHLYRKAQT